MSNTSSGKDIQQVIDGLAADNADKFDPVQFFYIQKLAEKSLKASDSVAKIIQQKAIAAVEQYQSDYKKSQINSVETVKSLAKQHPGMVDRCQSLLELNDFNGIKRLKLQLTREKRNAQIKSLTKVFNQPSNEEDSSQRQLSFDEFLLNQEQEAIQSFTERSPSSEIETNNQFADLKAHKLFKDSWVKMHSDKLVSQAIQDAPKDAGPLNSHMLAIRSLQAMKELSPEYLNRFVSYMDSLLWLEKSMEQLTASASKKAKGRGKNKRN